MKKVLTVIAAAFVAVAAHAQFYAGGAIGFQSGNNSYFVVAPEAGYSFNDQFSVGAVVGFGTFEDSHNQFTINPYVRWTFADWSPVKLFLDGSFDFTSLHMDNADKTYSCIQFGVKPGVALPLNEKLSLVAHLGFIGFASVDDDIDGWASYQDGFGANFSGNDLTFGVYYNF